MRNIGCVCARHAPTACLKPCAAAYMHACLLRVLCASMGGLPPWRMSSHSRLRRLAGTDGQGTPHASVMVAACGMCKVTMSGLHPSAPAVQSATLSLGGSAWPLRLPHPTKCPAALPSTSHGLVPPSMTSSWCPAVRHRTPACTEGHQTCGSTEPTEGGFCDTCAAAACRPQRALPPSRILRVGKTGGHCFSWAWPA